LQSFESLRYCLTQCLLTKLALYFYSIFEFLCLFVLVFYLFL